MAIIDDLKKKSESGFRTLKETAQDIAFNVEKQAKIGKKRYVDVTKIEKNINKLYGEIGEYIYEQFTCGKPVSIKDEFLKEKISAISALKVEVTEIEQEIEEIKRSQPPTKGDADTL